MNSYLIVYFHDSFQYKVTGIEEETESNDCSGLEDPSRDGDANYIDESPPFRCIFTETE